eukprot:366366-Chlamydomonas_euryale.AAC.7
MAAAGERANAAVAAAGEAVIVYAHYAGADGACCKGRALWRRSPYLASCIRNAAFIQRTHAARARQGCGQSVRRIVRPRLVSSCVPESAHRTRKVFRSPPHLSSTRRGP